MLNARNFTAILLLLVFFLQAPAQTSVPAPTQTSARVNSEADGNTRSAPLKTPILPLSEIREGMRGTALTVFSGREPESFNVEILGVVPGGVGPKQDMIVGSISGGRAERTAVFAGMSGSPVYIDGRLVGAIAYSFPFSKEAICGITPIEQMISIFEQKRGPAKLASSPRAISIAELTSGRWQPELPYLTGNYPEQGQIIAGVRTDSMLAAAAGQAFRPIGTPVTFTGISQQTLDVFAPQLLRAGLVPISAAGGSAAITPLKKADEKTLVGGTSVSMQLTRGDYSLAAAGTVTLREGDRIYAFGHPFLSLGVSDLPMAESSVVTVVPNLNNSFKLAVPEAMVGAMTQDRATGVFGRLGQAPRMIPVHLNVETSRGGRETLDFEIAKDEFLTPLLLNIAVYNALVSQERAIGEFTVHLDGEILMRGQKALRLQRRFSGGQAQLLAAGSVALPINIILRSRFEDLEIDGINLNLKGADGSSTATLERVETDSIEVRPGETVNVRAYARTSSGRLFIQSIPLTIPAGIPDGPITVRVGDGGAIQKDDSVQQFVPTDLSDLVAVMNKIKTPDRLYAKIYRTSPGVIIGSSELPNLPPSVLATLNSEHAAGGIKTLQQTVVAEIELAPADLIIFGEQKLTLNVRK